MLNKKLEAIAALIEYNSTILDVGTDHAYLPIYLSQKKRCKKIYASDISSKVLEGAKKNLDKYKIDDVTLFLSDGLDNINVKYDTLVIAGMGTDTILKIINGRELPKKIILSSNNHQDRLRKYMNEIGYSIKEENIVKENNKFYDIISYIKGNEFLSKKEIKYGKINDKEYFKYLYSVNKNVFKKMNFKNKIKNIKTLIELKILSIEKR